MSRMTKHQHILHQLLWQAITSEVAAGSTWDDVIAALEAAADTARSNKEFGLQLPKKSL